MNDSIDVTFVVAAYNTRETIAQTILSALSQIGVSVEILIIDDCSTDDTVEVVMGFSDPRVRLIRMAENRGPGAARNSGIAQARGRWIAVLDSDDEILADRSARMLARAKRLSAQIVVDNLMVSQAGSQPIAMFSQNTLEQRPILSLAEFIDSNVLFKSTFNFGYLKPMFSREFLEGHRLTFDESLRIGEDYILLASALACGGLCAIEPIPGYVYNIREGSISRVLKINHVDAMVEADHRFTSQYRLDGMASVAQGRRTRSLEDARAFLIFVENIKNRSLTGSIKAALQAPYALRHLRMPVEKRLRNLLKRGNRH